MAGIKGALILLLAVGPQKGVGLISTCVSVMPFAASIVCVYVCACMWAYPWLKMYVETRGYPLGVSSLPPPWVLTITSGL